MDDETQIQQRGQKWLEDLLRFTGVQATVTSDFNQDTPEESSHWLIINEATLTSEDIQTLIGEKGVVLDAIQYLANTTLNLGQSEDQQRAYTVELNGYRAQRQAELQEMAERAAQEVLETGQECELAALSAAERRQIHTFLKSFEQLETYSRGKEPDRRLVVRRAEIEA
ncbi:MAG: RNA-binding protein [Cyanothece sp. SIO1E1]|nr:RNA-binding protein [Cyanothece sp. SIO1E1]